MIERREIKTNTYAPDASLTLKVGDAVICTKSGAKATVTAVHKSKGGTLVEIMARADAGLRRFFMLEMG